MKQPHPTPCRHCGFAPTIDRYLGLWWVMCERVECEINPFVAKNHGPVTVVKYWNKKYGKST